MLLAASVSMPLVAPSAWADSLRYEGTAWLGRVHEIGRGWLVFEPDCRGRLHRVEIVPELSVDVSGDCQSGEPLGMGGGGSREQCLMILRGVERLGFTPPFLPLLSMPVDGAWTMGFGVDVGGGPHRYAATSDGETYFDLGSNFSIKFRPAAPMIDGCVACLRESDRLGYDACE